MMNLNIGLWLAFLNVLLIFSKFAFTFNLDAQFSTYFVGPRLNSYFGYSVDYYADTEEAWIVVGAPKASFNGEVYKCKYNSSNPLSVCDAIPIDLEPSDVRDSMLGSTVAVGKKKQLLSCAPQFIHTTSVQDTTIYDMIGICYLSKDFTSKKPKTYRYLPCINNVGTSHYGEKHSICQVGFSATYTKDKKKIVLGAVGSFYNQGSIMLVEDKLTRNITDLPTHTAEFKPEVPSPWTETDYYRQTYDANYMGYSVETGRTATNLALLITSAPRRMGFDLLGAVTVYDEELKTPLANFTGQQIGEYFGQGLAVADLNGDQLDDIIVGSPLYSDAVYKRAEVGRIYVYYQRNGVERENNGRHLVFSNPKIINGSVAMARFGSAITSLGDINNDGYEDIMVSAPYERSNDENTLGAMHGAVYVFNGGEDGIREKPSQKIHGTDLEKTTDFKVLRRMEGLGYSMKGGKDVDNNGYPDVVLGAHLSGQTVVIRARPVVKLVVTSEIKPSKVDLEALTCSPNSKSKSACFEVESCFKYTGMNLPPSIKISYSYDVDSGMSDQDVRSFLLDSSVRNMTLLASQKKCTSETVYMKKEVKDKLSPIAVTVSYWLRETHQPVEPILDLLAETSSTTEAEIYKNCGADDICTPDLWVTSSIEPTTALIGAYNDVILTSTVKNKKDNAYQTLLVVRYPQNTTFDGLRSADITSVRCLDVNQTVSCEVGNPLKTDKDVTVELKFGIHGLLGDVARLKFETLSNCTNEQTFSSASAFVYVDVEVKADISTFNASLPDFIPLSKLSEEAVNVTGTKAVSHTYEITNLGPSTLSAASVSLLWPLKTNNGEFLFLLDEVVTSGPIICHYGHIVNASLEHTLDTLPPPGGETTSNNADIPYNPNVFSCNAKSEFCFEMPCDVKQMEPLTDVLITLKGRIKLKPILASSEDSVIRSNLVFQIMEYPYPIKPDGGAIHMFEVSTYAVYPQTPSSSSVDWWIIAVSIAAGVLFLIIIILILWRCGFFKRKTPPSQQDKEQQQQLYPDQQPETE